uniref:Not1 domain-containing protein n=1 Tax=Mesocestoides corti TaxID=53468 RepID=A0A5K3G506_MESCO
LREAYRAVYAQLLVDILKFLSFYLHSAQIPEPIAVLYTAIFRLCLVLYYKFPDALAAATATTEATRGEHNGSKAVAQEAPHPPQGRKAGGQQANAAMLCSARATQHLANLQNNVELTMNVVLYICITAVKTLRQTGKPLNVTTVAHTPQMDIIH